MSNKVWVISCRCGWSRMVPRSTPAARRRQILGDHTDEAHRIPKTDEGKTDD